jgi:sigma-E factor negative regulatory protein RseA
MTDEHRQRLSQLQDGELADVGTATLLDAMTRDPDLRATWERYNLIGHAMRGEAIDPACRALADRVRERLASEPTVLAPSRLGRPSARRARRYAGFALAASVALVAILTAPALFDGAASVTGIGPAASRLVERQSIPLRRWQLERPELASKLDRYLVTHQATAPANGAKGMLPYATLVGYELGR